MSISRRGALLGASAAVAVAGVPTAAHAAEPLLALEQEWLALQNLYIDFPDTSDKALDPLAERLLVMEGAIYETPATTLAGIAAKLRVWGYYHGSWSGNLPYEDSWWRGDPALTYREEIGFAGVMCDLERLAGEARS